MNSYAFLTKDSFRVEVKASTPIAAYNKLMSIQYFADKITDSFIKYSKDGLAALDSWKSAKAEQ